MPCDDSVCRLHVCVFFVFVVPLLYVVEVWFKDFVASPQWAISMVLYVNAIVWDEVRQSVFVCVFKTVCNDRRRMRGGDGTLMDDGSPVVLVLFFCSAEGHQVV